MKRIAALLSILPSLYAAQPVWASSVMYEGSDLAGRSASVLFEVNGSQLIVTLTNTSTEDVLAPDEVLTAVFFDIEGDPTLTRQSATGDVTALLRAERRVLSAREEPATTFATP